MSIKIRQLDNEFRLNAELLLPKPVEEVFPFFADPKNLQALTPSFLRFKIDSTEPPEMKVGTLINYRLRIRGLPLRWTSLISHWEPPRLFVDEQIRGPYRYWNHQHHFERRDEKTLVRDIVRYQVFGGELIHSLFVKRDLMKIFSYRQKKLVERFS